MQVAYRAHNLFDAHLAKHLLEEADIPAFVMGESLLGGAGELPLFGVLRVCVPQGYEQDAAACLHVLVQAQAGEDGDLDALGDTLEAT
jgi:Putative prokaryotic signal transducing protein